MNLKEKLHLLNLAKDFEVTKTKDNSYIISSKCGNVAAEINIINNNYYTEYYITGCYNSSSDNIIIDIEELGKLRIFCDFLRDS